VQRTGNKQKKHNQATTSHSAISKHEFTNSCGDIRRNGKTTPVPHHVEEVRLLVVLKAGHGVTPGTEEGTLGLEAES
jgi:hypothetical protein